MKRSSSHKHVHKGRVPGFTLLEVILAIGLTSLLLAAIYSALDLYWKYTTLGHRQVEQAQIARAVFQKISHDLHCVTYRLETAEAETEGTGSADSETEEAETVEIQVTSTDDAYTSGNIGVYGDSQSLVLHTSRPARQPLLLSSNSGATSAQNVRSDLLSVSYFLAVAGAGGLQGAAGDQFRNTSGGGEDVQGVARLEGDRLSMSMADQAADLEQMASQSELLAPEISSLQFQYFDGTDWLELWDSTEYGTVPQAIRVTIGFRSDLQQTSLESVNEKINGYNNTYSMVIALPLARPAVLQTTEQDTSSF
ncbi:prepilin-type N-terminal cleavage/methylation domain-containing protein [Gimesia chilikensis]|uniref:prepilin-type N-terminal cleavage/methylation domain-containing protein n=1 Tax=Gimesia chilikensis TaxID=2605989 RepID=UPI0011EFCCB2|nr:prepilin-type N-terminal cleavage/methylation domain-containing protein [Gimesia chilikensis]KAA0134502.1 prepilin-type N-terminal cleavage/methylation domain-containing protein [Gimesia chilikensis]